MVSREECAILAPARYRTQRAVLTRVDHRDVQSLLWDKTLNLKAHWAIRHVAIPSRKSGDRWHAQCSRLTSHRSRRILRIWCPWRCSSMWFAHHTAVAIRGFIWSESVDSPCGCRIAGLRESGNFGEEGMDADEHSFRDRATREPTSCLICVHLRLTSSSDWQGVAGSEGDAPVPELARGDAKSTGPSAEPPDPATHRTGRVW